MRSHMFFPSTIALLLLLALAGAAAEPDGKIPVTTASQGALKEFLEGRTLLENLRLTDAYPHFQKAVEQDKGFALAHLFLSQTAPTAKAFFTHLDEAIRLAPNASTAEQLWIKGSRAGAYADPAKQRQLYTDLVGLFPVDERAQTLLGVSYFGQQQYTEAVEHLKKATEIARENAVINHVEDRLRIVNKDAMLINEPRNLIIANLTSKLLLKLSKINPLK